MFFESGPWCGSIAGDVLNDCTWCRKVFHLRSGGSYHFESLIGTTIRYREDYRAAVEVLGTNLILVAFGDLAAFDETLVAVVFVLDIVDRSLSQNFDNSLVVVFVFHTVDRSLSQNFDNSLVVVVFVLHTGDRSLLLTFDNNPAVVGLLTGR